MAHEHGRRKERRRYKQVLYREALARFVEAVRLRGYHAEAVGDVLVFKRTGRGGHALLRERYRNTLTGTLEPLVLYRVPRRRCSEQPPFFRSYPQIDEANTVRP